MNVQGRLTCGLLALVLSGCGGDPLQRDLLSAAKEHEPAMCAPLWRFGIGQFTVGERRVIAEVDPDPITTTGEPYARILAALREQGYVSGDPVRFRVTGDVFNRQTREGFALTQKGEAIFTWNKPLCFGEGRITGVGDYIRRGFGIEAEVTYNPTMSAAAKELGLEEPLRGAGIDGRGVAFFEDTNRGWRVESVDWAASSLIE